MNRLDRVPLPPQRRATDYLWASQYDRPCRVISQRVIVRHRRAMRDRLERVANRSFWFGVGAASLGYMVIEQMKG